MNTVCLGTDGIVACTRKAYRVTKEWRQVLTIDDDVVVAKGGVPFLHKSVISMRHTQHEAHSCALQIIQP